MGLAFPLLLLGDTQPWPSAARHSRAAAANEPRSRRSTILALLLLLACAGPAHARGLTLGRDGLRAVRGLRAERLGTSRAQTVDARLVRLTAHWSDIAPSSARQLRDPRDPADPAYAGTGSTPRSRARARTGFTS